MIHDNAYQASINKEYIALKIFVYCSGKFEFIPICYTNLLLNRLKKYKFWKK